MQEYIEAETFLGSGQDNTETLLAEVSPEARQEESFASERSALQASHAATSGTQCRGPTYWTAMYEWGLSMCPGPVLRYVLMPGGHAGGGHNAEEQV